MIVKGKSYLSPINDMQAINLLNLVKYHKENCHSPDCNISLILVKPIYEMLVDRDLTEEERKYFC